MTLTPETIELIEKKAEHKSVTSSILFIEVAHQILTDSEILASVKGDEWVSCSDKLPTEENQFDVYICEDMFGYGTICGWDSTNKKWYPKLCADNIQFESKNVVRYMDYSLLSGRLKQIDSYKKLQETETPNSDSGSISRFIG